MSSQDSAEDRAPMAGRSPETVDRILVGACGAIWLALLAMTVVAIVALVRLSGGHPVGSQRHSSWLLYTIIAVSAVVIAGAVPLLLRARRGALAEPADVPVATAADPRAPIRPADSPTEKIRVFGVDPYARREEAEPAADPAVPAAVLDRLWLRGTTSLVAAIGLALTGVAAATYLLAVGSDIGAWVALGVAGIITVAMPAVLVFHQRMLAAVVDES